MKNTTIALLLVLLLGVLFVPSVTATTNLANYTHGITLGTGPAGDGSPAGFIWKANVSGNITKIFKASGDNAAVCRVYDNTTLQYVGGANGTFDNVTLTCAQRFEVIAGRTYYVFGASGTFKYAGSSIVQTIIGNFSNGVYCNANPCTGYYFDSNYRHLTGFEFETLTYTPFSFNITAPSNDTAIQTSSVLLNYTANGQPANCWWSNGNGTNNTFACPSGATNSTNITGLHAGYNTITLYMNDSVMTVANTVRFLVTELFGSQIPSNITISNVIGTPLYINYTVSTNTTPNSVLLYYKSNDSTDNIQYYLNGTSSSGYYAMSPYANDTLGNYTFRLLDNNIYSGTFMIGAVTADNTAHTAVTLSTPSSYVLVELLNITTEGYGFFEIMANSTIGASPAKIYYCNNSYTTGTVAASPNCGVFGTINATNNFSHYHLNNSAHNTFTFSVNTTSGNISGVKVTPNGYFVFGGASGWNIWVINTLIRQGAARTTTNNGNAWTNQSYTVDAHLHQFSTSETLYYYLCSNNTNGTQYCSSVRSDLMELTDVPPSAVNILSPTENGVYPPNSVINISYTSANDPQGYPLYYSINLLYPNQTIRTVIKANNSNNLSLVWNSTGYYGTFLLEVIAHDDHNLSASSFNTFTLSFPPIVWATNITNQFSNTTTVPYIFDVQFNASNQSPECLVANYTSNDTNIPIGLLTGLVRTNPPVGVFWTTISATDNCSNTITQSMFWSVANTTPFSCYVNYSAINQSVSDAINQPSSMDLSTFFLIAYIALIALGLVITNPYYIGAVAFYGLFYSIYLFAQPGLWWLGFVVLGITIVEGWMAVRKAS